MGGPRLLDPGPPLRMPLTSVLYLLTVKSYIVIVRREAVIIMISTYLSGGVVAWKSFSRTTALRRRTISSRER